MSEVSLEKFLSGELNCAQSIITDYVTKEQQELAIMFMENFAGGLAMQGKLCGCIVGTFAALAGLSLKENTTPDAFIKAFEEKYKSLQCSQLLSYDISTKAGQEQAENSGIFSKKCPELIRFCHNWIAENTV